MNTISSLQKLVVDFRNERDWKQFHNPKDMALSLSLESGEVMEHFQWKNEKEIEEYLKLHRDEVSKELADVLYWLLLMSEDLEINLSESFIKKLNENAKKYPVEKAKGNHKKYNEL